MARLGARLAFASAVLSVAAGAPLVDQQARRQAQATLEACGTTTSLYTCASGDQCIPWQNVGDGRDDCPDGDDETVYNAPPAYCPKRASSGAISYMAFSTDPGKDYATVHEQESLGAMPCVFPFKFDANGDGELEVYNRCTKVCTTNADSVMVRSLNLDNDREVDSKTGCAETCDATNAVCQESRLWCPTSLDSEGRPLTAAYCTDKCPTEGSTGVSSVDARGDPCNQHLVLPWISWPDDPAGRQLNWTFTSENGCNARSTGSVDALHCPDDALQKDPRATDFRYFIARLLEPSTAHKTSFSVTVYHPNSPQKGVHGPCEASNPTCCEFQFRIMDAEDPALQYAPFGPDQTLFRCEDVTQCGSCQYEVTPPSASSDRVCKDWSLCDRCSFESIAPSAFADRVCQTLQICTSTQWQSAAAETTIDSSCSGQQLYSADVVCLDMNAKCRTSGTPGDAEHDPVDHDDTLEYDPEYLNMIAGSDFAAQCNDDYPVYTVNRACVTLLTCEGVAKEVVAVEERTDRDGDLVYVGDRICQCPDLFMQSDRNGYTPFPTHSQSIGAGTTLGSGAGTLIEYGHASDFAGYHYTGSFVPSKYTGNIDSLMRYQCTECSQCAEDGKYTARKCTHSRINMDYCQNNHPRPECTATEQSRDDSACWVPENHPDEAIAISDTFIDAMQAEFPLFPNLKGVLIKLFPVTRLGVLAALSLQDEANEIYRTFSKYCIPGVGSDWLQTKLLVESVQYRVEAADIPNAPNDFSNDLATHYQGTFLDINRQYPVDARTPDTPANTIYGRYPELGVFEEATVVCSFIEQCGCDQYQTMPADEVCVFKAVEGSGSQTLEITALCFGDYSASLSNVEVISEAVVTSSIVQLTANYRNRQPTCEAMTAVTDDQYEVSGMVCSTNAGGVGTHKVQVDGITTESACLAASAAHAATLGTTWQNGNGGGSVCMMTPSADTDSSRAQWVASITTQALCLHANDAESRSYVYEWREELVHDRVLATRTVCTACAYIQSQGQLSSDSCSSHFVTDRICQPKLVCGLTDYVTNPSSATANRECSELQACNPDSDTFQLTAPTLVTHTTEYNDGDGQCTRTADQYESNRLCACQPQCQAETAEVDPTAPPASALEPRTCKCQDEHFKDAASWDNWAVVYAAVPTAPAVCDLDISCNRCQTCDPATEYESTPCTADHDRVCKQRLAACDTGFQLFYDATHAVETHTTNCASVPAACSGTQDEDGNACALNTPGAACAVGGGDCNYDPGSGAATCTLNVDETGCSTASAAAGCVYHAAVTPAGDITCMSKQICGRGRFEDMDAVAGLDTLGREMSSDVVYIAGQSGGVHSDRVCKDMSPITRDYQFACADGTEPAHVFLPVIKAKFVKFNFGSTDGNIGDILVQQVFGTEFADTCSNPAFLSDTACTGAAHTWATGWAPGSACEHPDCTARTLLPTSETCTNALGSSHACTSATEKVVNLGSIQAFQLVKITTAHSNVAVSYSDDGTTYLPRVDSDSEADIVIPSNSYIKVGCDADGGAGALQLGCTKMYTEDRSVCTLQVCLCNEWESAPPTYDTVDGQTVAVNDRTCSPLTVCDGDQYESVYPKKRYLNQHPNADFMYISQRECRYFADYNSDAASRTYTTFDPLQWEVDYLAAGNPALDLCVADNDRPSDECNDGGPVPGGTPGPTLCKYGTDRDCPVRDDARADDCLPFYHVSHGMGVTDFTGMFWNVNTVKATLPDAIVFADAGSCYYTVDTAAKLLSWDFVGICAAETAACPDETDATDATDCAALVACLAEQQLSAAEAAEQRTLSAADNFFMTPVWTDINLDSDQKEAALANSEMNRIKITVSKIVTDSDGTMRTVKIGDNTCQTTTDGVTRTTSHQILNTPPHLAQINDDICIAGGQHKFPVAAVPPVYVSGIPHACHDANAKTGGLVEYKDSLPAFEDSARNTCDDYTARREYCDLFGDLFSDQSVTAREACCACGGGQRAESFTLQVTTRDPHADGESWVLVRNEDDGWTIEDPSNGDGNQTQHTNNHYDAPTEDWCVAQRIDTVTFELYVFDNQPPVLECPTTTTTVCTDGGIDAATAQETATVYLNGPDEGAAADVISCTSDGEVVAPCMLYPTAVTDNVNANAQYDAAASYSQTLQEHACASEHGDPGGKTWQAAPAVSHTLARATVQSGTSRTTYQHNDYIYPRFLIGTYTVTFTALDAYLNRGSCVITMEVKDCAPPLMTCIDVVVHTAPGVCYCTVENLSASAIDNSGILPEMTLVEQASGRPIDPDYKFQTGVTTVESIATDKSGALCSLDNQNEEEICEADTPLKTSCTFTVTCSDQEDPVVVSCPDVAAPCQDGMEHATLYHPNLNPRGTVRFQELVATDNSGFVTTPRYEDAEGVIIDTTYQFPWYEERVVSYVVADPFGNEARCSFAVQLNCGSDSWRLQESFELPAAMDCSTDGIAAVETSMTCFTAAQIGGLAVLVDDPDGGGRTAADYILLSTTAGSIATTGFTTSWKPHMPASSVWLENDLNAARSSRYDNIGAATVDTETFDCDDTGIRRGTTADNLPVGHAGQSNRGADPPELYGAEKFYSAITSTDPRWIIDSGTNKPENVERAVAGYAFVDNMDGPANQLYGRLQDSIMGQQYFSVTDPDGSIKLDLGVVRIPKPHTDLTMRTLRWYKYSYQLYGAGTLTVSVVGTRRDTGQPTSPIVLTTTSTENVCTLGQCDWEHVQEQFGESWADWSRAEFTLEVKCTDEQNQVGCADVRAYFDNFGVGHRGCTDPDAKNFDSNAVFEKTGLECTADDDGLLPEDCCDHNWCCADDGADNFDPKCPPALNSRLKKTHQNRNGDPTGEDWEGCIWGAAGDTTLDSIEVDAEALEAQQQVLQHKISRVLAAMS